MYWASVILVIVALNNYGSNLFLFFIGMAILMVLCGYGLRVSHPNRNQTTAMRVWLMLRDKQKQQ